jgi:Skp family chaperone for outer membrane proteins
MKARHAALFSLLLAAGSIMLFTSNPSRAQAQGANGKGIKIATASPSKIFSGMKEKTDVETKLKQQRDGLATEERSRRQKVQDLQSQLALTKPDAPQYEEQNNQFMQAAADFKMWGELSQAKAARDEKLQTKLLFDKITATIAEIAKERGIDLVIAEQPPMNIERVSAQDLTQLMAQRQVLYTNANVDITQDVIAKLDERYNAQKK